jgi:ABC-type multidrug transport system ATPase subunit
MSRVGKEGSTLCEQLRALVWLNSVRSLRSWKQTLAIILAPPIVVTVLVLLQQLANVVVDKEVPFPDANPVGNIPRCIPGSSGTCITLLYTPATPDVEQLLSRVALDNGLVMGEDIVPIANSSTAHSGLQFYTNTSLANANTCRTNASVLCSPMPLGNMTLLEEWLLECSPCDWVVDNETMTDYLLQRPNQTQIAILFLGEYYQEIIQRPTETYAILSNYSIPRFPFFGDDHALQTKLALDRAAIELAEETSQSKNLSLSLDAMWRPYPTPKPRVHGYDVAAANGAVWFFVPGCVIFFTLVSELVGEKESKRRVGMRTMGLKTAAFWVAWSLHGMVLAFVSAVLLCVCGWIANFTFFTNTDWFVPPVLFFFFNCAFVALAFLVSVLVRTQRTAQSIAYTLCLIGFVFQVVLCSAYGRLVDLMYSDGIPDWVVLVRSILSLYPAFHLSKAFYSIAALSSSEIDMDAGRVVAGPGFHFSDLWTTRHLTFFGNDIDDPAPALAFGYILANMVMYGVLAFYFDSVLAGDQGTPAHPCFCLGCTIKPRGPRPKEPRETLATPLLVHKEPSVNAQGRAEMSPSADEVAVSDPGVQEERRLAASGGSAFRVHVSNLRKVYHVSSYFCGLEEVLERAGCPASCCESVSRGMACCFRWACCCCYLCCRGSSESRESGGSGDVLALDNVSLTVKPGTCLGLLGHNGAGKSTLIKILSGLELPSEGSASVNGFNVATDVSRVQASLGYCPQHDLQWPELTAREHLQLFARLKGLGGSVEDLDREVEARLHAVNLVADQHRAAGTFSGGMRRRLSVAIACIGDPQVILLDEAATGLDPVNRSELWKMILDLKRGGDKALIVTTHDLQEAELLSDRVAIMGHGKIWCVGSSLDLKARYGGGYRVGVNAAQGREVDVIHSMATQLPSAKLMARDASALTFAVPLDMAKDMSRGLEWLETESNRFQGAMTRAALSRAAVLVNDWTRDHGGGRATVSAEGLTKLSDIRTMTAGMAVGHAAVVEADAEAFGLHAAGAKACIREWTVSLDTLESVFLQINRLADSVMGRAAAGAETDHDEEDDEVAMPSSDEGLAFPEPSSGALPARAGGTSVSTTPRALESRAVVQSFGARALCIKNLTLLSRQRGLCVCQIITPLIVMALLVLLQAIIKAEAGSFVTSQTPSVLEPFAAELGKESWRGAFASMVSRMGSLNSRIAPGSSPSVLARNAVVKHIDAPPSHKLFEPRNESNTCLEFFLFGADPSSGTGQTHELLMQLAGELSRQGNTSGLLGQIPQHDCQLANKTKIHVPYFFPREGSAEDVSVEVLGDLNFLDGVNDDDLDRPPPCAGGIMNCPAYLTPDGTVFFHTIQTPDQEGKGSLSFTIAVNDATVTKFRRPNNFTRLGFEVSVPSYVSEHAKVEQAGRMALVEMLVAAFSSLSGVERGKAGKGFLDASIKMMGSFPEDVSQNLMEIVEVFGSLLFPIALTLQLPLFTFVGVLEKETGLLELQKAMGLRMFDWYAINYLLNFAIYAIVIVFFWSVGSLLGFHVFALVPFELNLLLFAGWGFALVSMALFLASFMSDRRIATVASYVVALMGTLIGIVLADGIYGDIPPYSVGGIMPVGLFAFPPFALTRAIYLLNFNCIFVVQCPTMESAFSQGADGELGRAIISLYLCAVGYLVVGLYLQEVTPGPHGVPQHCFWCIPQRIRPPTLVDMLRCACFTRSSAHPDKHGGDLPASRTAIVSSDPAACLGDSSPLRTGETGEGLLPLFPYAKTGEEAWSSAVLEDTEVTDERRRIHAMLGMDGESLSPAELDSHAAKSGHTVIMNHLRKVYPGSTTAAVKDISIAIRAGETLAFLGENGCGKSTSVAMVSGGLAPTGGDAWVDGFHIVRDTGSVHLRTGITHQHERLWDDLTCEEHLMFYGRLKGVDPEHLKTEVPEALRAVGLYGVRERKAGALSGGMRRRLAVAISFSGQSQLCCEDELTTGSDIATRRRLWRVIQNAKSGRSGASAATTATRGREGAHNRRVLLVVTHLFDEVEALADRVCIVVGGRIRVIGTSSHLKERFGAAYRLSVSWPVSDHPASAPASAPEAVSARERAIRLVESLFPGARLDSEFDRAATFMIPRVPGRSLSKLFALMHEHASEVSLTNWSVGQVSLEDVFASVVHAFRDKD